eukprot:s1_g2435.t1
MSQVWKATFAAPVAHADAFATLLSDAFHPDAQAVATAEVEEHVTWSVEAYYNDEPNAEQIETIIGPLAEELNLPMPEVTVEALPDVNWVAKSLEGLAPIETDRFFVHGAHDADKCPASRIPLLVDAGEAFGTGHHGTTLGCLKFIEKECARRRPSRILDLGCGTGLLAIAAAKLTGQCIVASDIDPIATRVTRENARVNNMHPLIKTITAKGTDSPDLKTQGPYDLLIANILARPLAQMAPGVEQQLARGGTLILSGILHAQEQMVLSAYRSQGLYLHDRLRIDEWVTLRLRG